VPTLCLEETLPAGDVAMLIAHIAKVGENGEVELVPDFVRIGRSLERADFRNLETCESIPAGPLPWVAGYQIEHGAACERGKPESQSRFQHIDALLFIVGCLPDSTVNPAANGLHFG